MEAISAFSKTYNRDYKPTLAFIVKGFPFAY